MRDDEFADIVARAMFLSERLQGKFVLSERKRLGKKEKRIVEKRLSHWKDIVGDGDEKKFRKRLLLGGLNLKRIQQSLLDQNGKDHNLPPWSKTLRGLIETPSAQSREYEKQKQFFAFQDIVELVIPVARKKFTSSPLLSTRAVHDLEHGLIRTLASVASDALSIELMMMQTGIRSVSRLKKLKHAPSITCYQEFAQKFEKEGFGSLFKKYPVLGRLFAHIIDSWTITTNEFVQRIHQDLQRVEKKLLSDTSLKYSATFGDACVKSLQTNLSDPHRGGRSVIILELYSGLKLVYKPKPLELEKAYNLFLQWCNKEGLPSQLRVLKIFDRGDYGWTEYADHTACKSKQEVQRFYHRIGEILCIQYVLGGTDCHLENIIASGDQPVIIDGETLLLSKMLFIPNEENNPHLESVLRIGMLPSWTCIQQTSVLYDAAGIRYQPPRVTNQKNLSVTFSDYSLHKQSIPLLNGNGVGVNDFLNDCVDGFVSVYRFFLAKRTILLGNRTPLKYFRSRLTRHINRPTRSYYRLLTHVMQTSYLRHGIDWSLELEVLWREVLDINNKYFGRALVAHEQKELEQLNVPFIFKNTSNTNIFGSEKKIHDHFFKRSGYQSLLDRLRRLDERDLARQAEIIINAMRIRGKKVANSPLLTLNIQSIPTRVSSLDSTSSVPTSRICIRGAQAIAVAITERAFRNGIELGTQWLGPDLLADYQHYRLRHLPDNLFDGRSGVALFLAAVYRTLAIKQYHDIAYHAFKTIASVFKGTGVSMFASDKESQERKSIGGGGGLGSFVYVFTKASEFLNAPEFLITAKQVAKLITPQKINNDISFDVIDGSAGAILGLLSYYDKTSDRTVLHLAELCGERLLKGRILYHAKLVWKQKGLKRPLTGFSHGSAGIAYALLRLFAVTGQQKYLNAAQEGIAFEQMVYSKKDKNWPDLRKFHTKSKRFQTSWCHGAPGIALARIGGLFIFDSPLVRRDIEEGLNTTLKAMEKLSSDDTLCCGISGLVDILLVAEQQSLLPALHKFREAMDVHIRAIAQKPEYVNQSLSLENVWTAQRFCDPTFFQGMSGIGYELLRFAFPKILPSILLWK